MRTARSSSRPEGGLHLPPGADPPGTRHPSPDQVPPGAEPPCEQNERQVQKYYLAPNFVCGR